MTDGYFLLILTSYLNSLHIMCRISIWLLPVVQFLSQFRLKPSSNIIHRQMQQNCAFACCFMLPSSSHMCLGGFSNISCVLYRHFFKKKAYIPKGSNQYLLYQLWYLITVCLWHTYQIFLSFHLYLRKANVNLNYILQMAVLW